MTEPGVEHARQRVVGHRVDAAQPDVGQRADGERHAVGDQPADQRRVLDAADAVVDALDAQHVQRLPDVVRRTLLPGVGDLAEPEVGGRLEHLGEVPGRVADLGGVEADAGHLCGEPLSASRVSIASRGRGRAGSRR